MSKLGEVMGMIMTDPARAEALCRELIAAEPNLRDAKLMLVEALRRKGDLAAARAEIEPMAAADPNWFAAQRMLGLVFSDRGKHRAAADVLRRAAQMNPSHPYIWRELGDAASAAGDARGAEDAYLRQTQIGAPDPRLVEASRLLQAGEIEATNTLLAGYLAQHPTDPTALVMNAEAQARASLPDGAERSLRRALELAPGYGYARHSLGQLLLGLGRLNEALEQAGELERREPENIGAKRLIAAILVSAGDDDEALAIYAKILAADASRAPTWMSYGHVLKTVGRTQEGIEAYRRSVTLTPSLGEAWWSLANLKTLRFSDSDIAQMQAQLLRADLTLTDRVNMRYALGKAFEDRGESAVAFSHYAEGAKLYRRSFEYDSGRWDRLLARSREVFTRELFEARAGSGDRRPDPIFVIGMPRAGSTLVEQVLASHSRIEGTMELQDLPAMAIRLGDPEVIDSYLDRIGDMDAKTLQRLGAEYLAATQPQRKTARPLFIDKTPNNFSHVGLIQLISPRAKIIDVRRHPLACGWSCYKQHWAKGQLFTYDLRELGLYYRDYVRLMAHYDAVLPGRVHRVIYEHLVRDPENEIRKLIAYCELPFEDAVLRPHENQRAVRTPSAEQVRQPISDKGLDDWRVYETHLGPLKEALGDVLTKYPEAH